MSPAPSLASRARRNAATRRLAASSVARYASGFADSAFSYVEHQSRKRCDSSSVQLRVASGYDRGRPGLHYLREFVSELACDARVSRSSSTIWSGGDL